MLTRMLLSFAACVLMPTIAAGQARVPTPTFSVEGGEYSTVVIVEVRVSAPGATIRFTQNGADPTPADPVIASGSTLAINTSLTLKARAFMHGRRPSEVRTARFTIAGARAVGEPGAGHADAGGAQSLIATPDGRVLQWTQSGPPTEVAGLPAIAAVAAGGSHALALTKDGRVYAWGANQAGQLGDGTRIRRHQPVVVGTLTNVVRIAAGAAHSLAITADGLVWAWGSNADGQLGMTSTRNALIPATVPSLAEIVDIDAGDDHSLAVSRQGQLLTWGANRDGQLGDGSIVSRHTPFRLALSDVAQAAAGANHTLAVAGDGRVYAWGSGRRGQLGSGGLEPTSRPLEIADLRAVAVRAGRHFSAAVNSTGAVMTWGANESGQLGDGTSVDRPRPVAGPSIDLLSSLALGDRHAIAVTSTGDVWAWGGNTAPSELISDLADWGPPFLPDLPDALAPPTIQPPSGAYAAPTTITLSSTEQEVILRYTLDGTDPTEDSPVYAEPFVVAAPTTVKARAYASSSGVEPSEVASASYQIDMSPPTIVAHVSPPATAEWFMSPVTVTFDCADDSGVVSCPAPVTVSNDGASQLVTGVAADPAGNTTTVSVTLNLDLAPPSVLLNAAPEETAEARLVLSGRAFDLASGVAGGFRCNGAAVEIVNEAFECEVALHPGRNSVTFQASDVAGHVTNAGIVITRVGDATAITISPDSRMMVVDESAPLRLHDEFGRAVLGASWSSSDAAIVTLSDDDPPFVTAIAPGTASIIATRDGRSAEAVITVDGAGVLAPGSVRWTIPATPGTTMEFPVFTHRVEPDVPEMFAVETTASGEATLRALTRDGEVLWQQHSPGVPLMGDSFGGVLAGVYHDFSWDFKALVRLGTAGGVAPWRYESRGMMPRPAQAPDGTVYAIEHVEAPGPGGEEIWDKHVVVIDGRTGQELARYVLARELNVFTADLDGQVISESPRLVCASTRVEQAPSTVGPIVGSDGRGYLLVRRRSIHKFDTCVEQQPRHRRIINHGVDLLMLSPQGEPVIQPVFTDNCDVAAFQSSSCDVIPELKQLVPDGIGGMLASWDRFESFVSGTSAVVQRIVTRRADDGTTSDLPVHNSTWIETVGQAGVSYVFAAGAWSAVDVTSWTPRWTASLGTFAPLAAHPEGGAALQDAANGMLRFVDAEGQSEGEPVAFGFHRQVVQHNGEWIGVRDGKLHAVAGEFPDATRFYSAAGNAQFQLSVRNPGVGIYLKTHWAVEGLSLYKHASIRIVPSNQAFWRAFDPVGFFPRDAFGNHFMTLGAGPGPNDTSFTCDGTLTKGRNRDRDVLEAPSSLDAYPLQPGPQENQMILALLDRFSHYSDNLPYACFPESNPGFYNSNSFARGLQDAVGLTPPTFGPRIIIPGWFTPVPQEHFQPQ